MERVSSEGRDMLWKWTKDVTWTKEEAGRREEAGRGTGEG